MRIATPDVFSEGNLVEQPTVTPDNNTRSNAIYGFYMDSDQSSIADEDIDEPVARRSAAAPDISQNVSWGHFSTGNQRIDERYRATQAAALEKPNGQ